MANPWDELQIVQAPRPPNANPSNPQDPWADLQSINQPQAIQGPKKQQSLAARAFENNTFGRMASDLFFKSPEQTQQEELQKQQEPEEGLIKTIGRYASQIGQAAPRVASGLTADILKGTAAQYAKDEILPSNYDISLNPELAKVREQVQPEVERIAPSLVPTYSDIEELGEKAGLPLKAKTTGQKALAFGAETALFQPGGLTRKVLSAAGSAGAKAALMQTDLREPFTNIPVFIPESIKSPVDLKKLLAGKMTPDQAEVEGLRRQLGLAPLPLTETTTSPLAKGIEGFVNLTGIGENEFNRVLKSFDKSYVDNISDSFTKMSPKEFMSSLEAGEALKKGLTPHKPERILPQPIFGQTSLTAKPRRITQGGQRLGLEVPTQRKFQNPTEAYERTLSENLPANDVQGGVDVVENIVNQNQHHKTYFNNAYDDLREAAKTVRPHQDPEFADAIQESMKMLRGSYVTTNEEARVLGALFDLERAAGKNINIENLTAKNLRDMGITSPEGVINFDMLKDLQSLKNISLDRLIKTQKSLNSIIDTEVQGGFKQNLQEAKRLVNQAINRFSEEAPEVVGNLRELDSQFAQYADVYRSDVAAPFLNPTSRNYKELFDRAKKLSNFNVLGHILNETPQGTEIANSLKREMFFDTIGKKLQEARTPQDFERLLTRDNVRELQNFRTTLNPEQITQFDNYMNQISERIPRVQNVITKITESPLSSQQLRGQIMEALSEQKPEALIKSLDSLENVKNIKQILNATPQGIELWNSLSRFKLEQQFGDLMLSSKQGRFNYKNFEKLLENKDSAAWIKEVGGQDYYDKLKKMQGLSFKLSPKFKQEQFLKKPSIAKGIVQAQKWTTFATKFASSPLDAFTYLGQLKGTNSGIQIAAKKLADPKFITLMNDLAAANSKGDAKALTDVIAQLEKATLP